MSAEELKLLPFQEEGVQALMRGIQILGDDVGLGKTIQSIAFCERMCYQKILVVCPAPLKENWRNELKKFFNIEGVILEGNAAERQAIFSKYINSSSKYLIVNYEQLRDVNLFLTTVFWHCIILDEAHRIKNYRSKTYKWAKKLKAERKIALTATPITNHPMEIFSVANFVRPNYFNWYKFRAKYGVFGPVYKGPRLKVQQDVVAWHHLDKLYEELLPIMIKRKKIDVLPQLPPRSYKTYFVELSNEERRIHDFYMQKMKEAFKAEDDQMFSYLALAQQICNGTKLLMMSESENVVPCQTDKNSKVDVLKDALDDLGDQRAIIFTKFERMARIINEAIPNKCFLITGETKDKISAIEKFKKSDKQFLVATDCLNYGVNLEFLNILVHFDLAWTPAKMEQREGRIDRITQTNKMLVIKLITKNTFEDRIVRILEEKQRYINEAVLGGYVGMSDIELIQALVKN